MVNRNAVSTEFSFGMQTHKSDLENDKNTMPKTFKAMQRETTVYEFYVELKEDSLTEQGFLDLVKVPKLYVAGAGPFLKNLRKKNNLSQKDIGNILEVHRIAVKSWEYNINRMPLQKLVKISEILGVSRDTIYSLIDQGKLKTKNNLPVKFEKICNIVRYFNPHKSNKQWHVSIFNCSNETLSEIEAVLNVNAVITSYSHANINCKDVRNYLTTFFQYTKVPKINPPLTQEVKLWHDKNVDLKRAVIIPCLQSDGCIANGSQDFRIIFSGKNKKLHNIFVDAMYYEYNEWPSSYFYKSTPDACNQTTYVKNSVKEIADEILTLARSTKTSPSIGQTVEEYLKEPQPNLNYLINASDTEQKIAFRIWMSTEGYVTITKHKYIARGCSSRLKEEYVSPFLAIACAHPVLAKQLQQISRSLNIPLYIRHLKKKWFGIDVLTNSTILGSIEFLKLGGFVKGVKISAKSKNHKGVEKQTLLLGILEFKKREQENTLLRKLSRKKIHYEINKIIENREYKSEDYYIKYFS